MALDREQLRRDAELDKPPNLRRPPWGTIAQEYIVALLDELEQAERKANGPSGLREQLEAARKGEQIEHRMRQYAESRLANVPPLVEALQQIDAKVHTLPDEYKRIIRAALAAWDAE